METKTNKSFITTFIVLIVGFQLIEARRELKSKGPTPVYKCSLVGTSCTFSNVIRNWTHYAWDPVSDDPNLVTEVKFTGSKMAIFTSNICQKFPSLKELYLVELGIENVQESAFNGCTELTGLWLNTNHIKVIHRNMFGDTIRLQTLDFHDNQLMKLDFDARELVFENLRELKVLNLSMNNLTEFSSQVINSNRKLEELSLYSNELSDVSAGLIVNHLPNLKRFLLDDNEISCTRVVELNQFLQSKGILNDHLANNKIRYYPQLTVFGDFKCNPDISFMASNFRKGIGFGRY